MAHLGDNVRGSDLPAGILLYCDAFIAFMDALTRFSYDKTEYAHYLHAFIMGKYGECTKVTAAINNLQIG